MTDSWRPSPPIGTRPSPAREAGRGHNTIISAPARLRALRRSRSGRCSPSPSGDARFVAVLASASGVRIDCDYCGAHVSGHELSAEDLRHLTGFVRIHGRDYCPRCHSELPGRSFSSGFAGASKHPASSDGLR